ncbi:MAG: polysaccharide deacetylase family protein [Fibrobacterota bacterium]
MKNVTKSMIGILAILSTQSIALDPSPQPPGGLAPENVPQFVTIGFDDNAYSGDSLTKANEIVSMHEGMRWAEEFFKDLENPTQAAPNAATYDGTPARVSFYMTTYYASGYNGDNPVLVRKATRRLYEDGHEIGNHTQNHNPAWNNTPPDKSKWLNEMQTCNSWLTKPLGPSNDSIPYWKQASSDEFGSGIPVDSIRSFRTPFLICDNPTFSAMQDMGFTYDCSIEEGHQDYMDGTNYYWPYTLDNGASDVWPILMKYSKEWDETNSIPDKSELDEYPGLWELPNHVLIVPPDDKCAQYGVEHSLLDKIGSEIEWFNREKAKFVNFDYNLWHQAKLNKNETAAILKYNLDLRYNNNRAPFMMGAHTGNFTSKKAGSPEEARLRQEAYEEVIRYALEKPDVRVVPGIDIINWCKDPVPLSATESLTETKHTKAADITVQLRGNRLILPSLPGSRATVRLFSPRGQLLQNAEVQSAKAILSTEGYTPGMYVLTVNTGIKTYRQKVLIP